MASRVLLCRFLSVDRKADDQRSWMTPAVMTAKPMTASRMVVTKCHREASSGTVIT